MQAKEVMLMRLPYGPKRFWGREAVRVGNCLVVVSPLAFKWYIVHRIIYGALCVDN